MLIGWVGAIVEILLDFETAAEDVALSVLHDLFGQIDVCLQTLLLGLVSWEFVHKVSELRCAFG